MAVSRAVSRVVSVIDLRSRSQGYIALRRAVGYQDRPAEKLLLDFVAFVESRGVADSVTAQVAVDWACGPDLDSHRNRAARLAVVRGFLAYVRAVEPRTEVPAVGLLRRPTPLAPHIFSDEEIAAVLRAARALGPRGSLRPHTYATLIGHRRLVRCCRRFSPSTCSRTRRRARRPSPRTETRSDSSCCSCARRPASSPPH